MLVAMATGTGKTFTTVNQVYRLMKSQVARRLTASERVSRAMTKLEAGKELTPDQRRWLDRIRQHLTENLSVDRDDFDLIPALSHEGGWRAADRAFAGRLGQVLAELNAAVAA